MPNSRTSHASDTAVLLLVFVLGTYVPLMKSRAEVMTQKRTVQHFTGHQLMWNITEVLEVAGKAMFLEFFRTARGLTYQALQSNEAMLL